MIRQVRGRVLETSPLGAVIEVAGFGIFVCMASPEGLIEGEEGMLHTYLAVKQDGLELYGFTTTDDMRFFEMLLGVPGVGPKTALAILRKAPREALRGAIGKRDLDYLTRVAGLGKKAAEKILVELSEKIGITGTHDEGDAEVFDTLVALGYTEREARACVANIPKDVAGKDARLKAALTSASR
ncbi:MAG: Holliday junction helicase RuvA, holliday junction helicase RuvA [Parcubacteria group bacterium]|nr:Holliday junction helicase RuvA, holliday junction helicase RuvA [Parcubacteria group bacterium]